MARNTAKGWQDLFQAVLLYDLTSTYIEGAGEKIPKAKHGYSRDHRFDCRQVVIALVVTPEGFPLDYGVMEGNTSDCTTLRGFLGKIEAQYGKARRVWDGPRNLTTFANSGRGRKALANLGVNQISRGYLSGTMSTSADGIF